MFFLNQFRWRKEEVQVRLLFSRLFGTPRGTALRLGLEIPGGDHFGEYLQHNLLVVALQE
jgi:hypothetical protein